MSRVEIRDLHKRFGSVNAVNGLSFDVDAGRVTGFLGPNGAGKSTTLRALLGLVHPTAGTATFDGRRYEELERPSAHVGAVLEDTAFHPGRTGRNHLRVLAVAGEHPSVRVEEVLATVGLTDAADRRVKGYSMGMRQRLAIAGALLGRPAGPDPRRADQWAGPAGHQLDARPGTRASGEGPGGAGLEPSARRGRSVGGRRRRDRQAASCEATERSSRCWAPATARRPWCARRIPRPSSRALERRGHRVERDGDELIVIGATPEQVGEIAAEERLALIGLAPRSRSLEAAFFELTADRR